MRQDPHHFMKYLCECMSLDCHRSIEMSLDEATNIQIRRLIVIADGAQTEPTDVLIEKRDGYSLYQEGTIERVRRDN